MKRKAWVSVGTALAAALCAGAALAPMALARTAQVSQAARLSMSSYDELAPQGASIAGSYRFTLAGHNYVVAATSWSKAQPLPWLIVARQLTDGRWDPEFIGQTQQAFSLQTLTPGPRQDGRQLIAASFIVDAATGLMSHVYLLSVSAAGVQQVGDLPGVVGMEPMHMDGSALVINGLNFQARVRWVGDRAQIDYTPLRALLDGTDLPVGFVLGKTFGAHGREVSKVSLIGPSVVHAKVGQTLSFVPLNNQAQTNMLGSVYEGGKFEGISVYAAPPGAQLKLYQAAEILGNTVRFTQPGSYAYAIVPPGYTSLAPDADVAIVKVDVTS